MTLRHDARRRFLAEALRAIPACAIGVTAAALAGCGAPAPEPPPGPLSVPLDRIPSGGRLRVMWGGTPVEIVRTPDGAVARSLRCTHVGCEVKWDEASRRYHCPCHEGVYDEEGRVIAGPPPQPLSRIRSVVSGGNVVLGG